MKKQASPDQQLFVAVSVSLLRQGIGKCELRSSQLSLQRLLEGRPGLRIVA
jgi:hypothetical protein